MSASWVRRVMPRALVGAVVALLDVAIVFIYHAIIYSQLGPRDDARISFVTYFIVLLAVLSLSGALAVQRRPRIAAATFLASGAGHLGLGILAIFSIGWPLILGGLALLYLGTTGRHQAVASIVAPLVMLTILGLGIAYT
jgi:hypothetical protein